MNLFEITTLVSVIVLLRILPIRTNSLPLPPRTVKSPARQNATQDEKAKELKLQSVVESAILPYNMGKNIDYVKNTIVKSKLSTEFHLLK